MKALLRGSTRRIFHGMLFGLGFGIAAGLIYYLIYYFIYERLTSSIWNDAAMDKVVITSHEEVKQDDKVSFLGTIENHGTESVRSATVQVDLLDKSGKFVDQCTEYVRGSLKAGETRNFRISCGSKDRPVAEHATYKLRVSS